MKEKEMEEIYNNIRKLYNSVDQEKRLRNLINHSANNGDNFTCLYKIIKNSEHVECLMSGHIKFLYSMKNSSDDTKIRVFVYCKSCKEIIGSIEITNEDYYCNDGGEY